MKRLFLVATIGLVFGLYGAGADQLMSQQATAQRRVRSTAPIRLLHCRIHLKDHATLASERIGILGSVDLEEGDLVQKGQQVARLKDEVAKAVLERTEKEASNRVEIQYAQASFKVAYTEYQKALEANLDVPKSIPDIEVLRLHLAARRAELQIEQAQHRFAVTLLNAKEARAQLDTYRVEAPFDGVVTQVFKSKGEAVRQGDPILEIVSTKQVRVEGHVSVNEATNVKRGTCVQVRLDIPSGETDVKRETFEGQIVFVDVTTQPITGQVRVLAEVTNRDNILRAGLTATMIIDPSRKPPVKTAGRRKKGKA